MASKYNPATVDKLYHHLCLGMPIRIATSSVGINIKTYYAWLDKYPEFQQRMDEARAEFVEYHLTNIKNASECSAKYSQWLLEHTFPELYSLKRMQEVEAVEVLAAAGWLPASFMDKMLDALNVTNDKMRQQFEVLDTLEDELQSKLEQNTKRPTPLPVLLDTLDIELI